MGERVICPRCKQQPIREATAKEYAALVPLLVDEFKMFDADDGRDASRRVLICSCGWFDVAHYFNGWERWYEQVRLRLIVAVGSSRVNAPKIDAPVVILRTDAKDGYLHLLRSLRYYAERDWQINDLPAFSQTLASMLAEMSLRRRQAIILGYGLAPGATAMPISQIAAELGVTTASARSAINGGLQRLRNPNFMYGLMRYATLGA